MRSILIVKLGALGDLILAEGAIRDIRAHHEDCSITLLTRPAYVDFMRRCPWIDNILVDSNEPRYRLDAMLRLRDELSGGFELVYDLQNSRRTAFYRRWLMPRQAEWCAQESKRDKKTSVPERHKSQLARAGLETSHSTKPYPVWLVQGAGLTSFSRLAPGSYIVLLPGSSQRHMHKRWPHYRQLAGDLVNLGYKVVVVPGPEEPDINSSTMPGTIIRGATGQSLNMIELADILHDAACVVGNDSGPTHLAACLDVPGVAFFETNNPSRDLTGIENRNFICLTRYSLSSISPTDAIRAIEYVLSSRNELKIHDLNY